MTAEHMQGDEPLIAKPALTLDALRQAVTAVVPSRLPDEDGVLPIRHFYQRWGAAIAIERRLAGPDEAVRERAIQDAAELVQVAYHEVASPSRVVIQWPRAMIARASSSDIGGPSTGWPVWPAMSFIAA